MARWFIIHAYSGFEHKVKEAILSEAQRTGLEALVEAVEVPSESITEVKRGKKVQTERKTMPGYVLAKLTLTDDVYHLVRDTPKVSGFLGAEGGKRPLPVPQREVDRILGTADEPAAERPRPQISFEIGEQVRVNEGAFQGFEGGVEEVDEAAGRLKVSVSIFGRATPVDLEYGQVDKIT